MRKTLTSQLENNREAWLTNCAELLVRPLETIVGQKMPNFRITMGFPSRNALSVSRRVIGQCWNRVVCHDGTYQLFISPMIHGNLLVSATVAHELAHAIVGTEHGHRRPFGKAVRPLGLVGKLTATVPGPEFEKLVTPMFDKLGAYPHNGMFINPKYAGGKGRLIKSACQEEGCEYKVRITQMWLDDAEYGAPICPKHGVRMG